MAESDDLSPTKRVPWGFVPGKDGLLVANTSAAQRWHRAELGETAIRICNALGVSMEILEEMIDVQTPQEIIAALQTRRS